MSGESWAVFEDRALASGFTQIPNAITRDPNLSMQAKYLYGLLLSYAWQDAESFPGLERLRQDTGAKTETLRKYLYELVEAGKLEIKRRGRGKTNTYVFKALTNGQDNPQRGTSRQPPTGEVKTTPNGGHKEYSVEEYSVDTPNGERPAAPADAEGWHFEEYLREALGGADVPLKRAMGRRYTRDANKLLKEGVTPEDLYEACDRVISEWGRVRLALDDALRDVRNGRQSNGRRHLQAVPDSKPGKYAGIVEGA